MTKQNQNDKTNPLHFWMGIFVYILLAFLFYWLWEAMNGNLTLTTP